MRVPITLQVVLLTLFLTFFYMMVGQAVPQKEVQPPEVIEVAKDISSVEMAEIGKTIFEGKGICATCHTIGKSGALRFPDMDGIATRATTRRPGMTALDYLAESLYEPNIFIVEGFSPGMPAVDKPPIGLTDDEILTVIAYLQSLGGEPTVTMETKLVYTGGELGGAGGESAETQLASDDGSGDGSGGATGYGAAYGCAECHGPEADPEVKADALAGVGDRLDGHQLWLALSEHDDARTTALTLAEIRTVVEELSQLKGEG